MIQLPSNDRPFTHHVVILSVLCGKGLFSYVAMVCFEQGYNTNVSRSMLSQKLHDMIRNQKSIYIREARGRFFFLIVGSFSLRVHLSLYSAVNTFRKNLEDGNIFLK